MKNIKLLALAVVSLLLLIVDWWLFKNALYGQKSLLFWVWPAIITALWIASFSFFSAVNSDKFYFVGANLLGFLAYLLIMPKDLYVILGGVVFTLLAWWFEQRVRQEEKSRANFSLRRLLSSGLTIIVYGLLILLGSNIYYHTDKDFKQHPEKFYEQLGQTAANSLPFLSKGIDAKIDPNQTLDDFLINQAKKEAGPEISQLNKAQLSQLIAGSREQLLKQFQLSASGSETLQVIIGRYVSGQIKNLLKGYERFFPLIFTLIVLATLRAFAFIFTWLVFFISWILFKFLLLVGFFNITKVPVEVDKLGI